MDCRVYLKTKEDDRLRISGLAEDVGLFRNLWSAV